MSTCRPTGLSRAQHGADDTLNIATRLRARATTARVKLPCARPQLAEVEVLTCTSAGCTSPLTPATAR